VVGDPIIRGRLQGRTQPIVDNQPISALDDPRAILESMGDAFYAVDSNWRIVYANRHALDFWGVAADTVIGRVIWERFPAVAGSVVEQGLRQARAEQRTVILEAPSPITGVYVSATYCPSGTGACAYWRDISHRIAAEQALRQSEEHLRLAQEAGGIGTWEWDLQTDQMIWSAQMFRVLGLEPSDRHELKGLLLDCVHPEERRTTEDSLATFRSRPGPLRMEVRVVWPNGTTRWIVFLGRVTADPRGKPTRILGITIDGTSRRRGEDAIREDGERLRLAMQAGGLATWEFNQKNQIRYWSPEAAVMHGFPADKTEISRAEWRRMVHPDDLPMVRTKFGKVLSGLSDYSVEYRIVRPDGEVRWTAVHGTYLDGSDTGRVIGVLQDITERKQTEDLLRESESRLRELLATIDLAAVFIRELDGRIRFWSKGCERLYGWTAEDAVGRVSHTLLDTVFPASLADIEATLIQHGEWYGDVLHRRRDGSVITVAMHKVLRRDTDGRPIAILENLADVTALRKMEADLRTLNHELEDRVRAEVAAREAAQTRAAHAERIQALGQLAGGIAHDFNNILQGIQAGAALMGRRATDASEVRRFSGLILDAAERGASITRRLLAFARRGDLRAEAIMPADLLQNMREVLIPALGAAVQLRIEASPSLPPLLADKGQLETALVNLAINGRDAMPLGGMLSISAVAGDISAHSSELDPAGLAPGRYIRITVADTGEGMEAATLGRALEPFFTTKPLGHGTGLGLPMVKGFAEQSGGAMTIESQPGRGTTVSLWLPQALFEVHAGGTDANRVASPTARVLIVDDDVLVRELLATEFEEFGYDVIVAQNGDEALALLSAGERVDALLTDLSMPEMDGLALIRAAQAQRPKLPTILLTGYAGDGTAMALSGAMSGSFTLLRKPITGEQLAGRLAALLEKSRAT
jgi:PAS domain S-box-containing protein